MYKNKDKNQPTVLKYTNTLYNMITITMCTSFSFKFEGEADEFIDPSSVRYCLSLKYFMFPSMTLGINLHKISIAIYKYRPQIL